MKVRNVSLPTHGQSPYYGIEITHKTKGIRFSWGGYRLKFWTYYPRIALHIAVYKFCLSILLNYWR